MTSALPFDDFRTLLAQLPPLDATAAAQVRQSFARMDKPKNSLGRLEEIAAWLAAVDRPRAAGAAPGGRGLRRQSWRRAPRHLAARRRGDAAPGRACGGRRRGGQPDLHRPRSRPEGLRSRAAPADRRLHRGCRTRRARLRRDHGVRHGGGRRRRRPAGDRRHRRRRLDRCRRDLRRALRRQRRRLGRAWLRRRRRNDRPQGGDRRPRARAACRASERPAGNPAPLRRPRIRGDRRRDPRRAHGEGAGRARRVFGDGGGSDPASRQSGRARSLPAVARLGRARPPQGDRQARTAAAARPWPAITARGPAPRWRPAWSRSRRSIHSGMAAALPHKPSAGGRAAWRRSALPAMAP